MQFRYKQIALWCVLLFCSWPTGAQNKAAPVNATLFKRYEDGAAPNRLNEDVLTLSLEQKSKDKTRIGVRVCSKEPMPVALMTANADPFYIVERLVDAYAYLPERVVYLRSEDCLSSSQVEPSVTEVWMIPDGASFPAHVEAAAAGDVKRTALGKQEMNRGARDYRDATQKLIGELRQNPAATGVVFGYFLKRPSRLLEQRLREVTRTLNQSGLARDRYLVRATLWNDEASETDKEPTYPTLFLVEIKRFSKQSASSVDKDFRLLRSVLLSQPSTPPRSHARFPHRSVSPIAAD